MGHFLMFVAFILIALQINSIKGQGEQCYTPNNQYGTCVVLPQCPYLVEVYGANPRNQQVINFLIGSQRNCGTRSINRNPLVCCNNPQYQPQPTTEHPADRTTASQGTFTEPQPITRPAPATQPTTTTRPPTTTGRSAALTDGSDCQDPNGIAGVCKSIRDCPPILTEFVARQRDPTYTRYIQSSNAICNYVQPNICCPLNAVPTTQPPVVQTPKPRTTEIQGRLLTSDEGCGISNETHTRIVGGEPAKLGGWPWMALVGYTDSLGVISWRCGGSLITSRHVLTAAHCIKSSITTVRLGEHDTSSETETNVEDVRVVKTVKYPQYDMRDGNGDLAILYLERDVEFTWKIHPVCIPFSGPIRTKSFLRYMPFVAGWGKTQEGGKTANILQELQIEVLDNAVCKDRYQKQKRLLSEKQFNDAVLCAGVLTGGQDSCQGDSGGPLMAPNGENGETIFYQIGVVSYGIGCARVDVPGVYSRVQTFVDWIQEKVAEPV